MSEHTHGKECQKFFEKISELIDGELDTITAETIEKHIQDCPECIACYSTFKKSVEIFQNLGSESTPSDFLPKLKKFIQSNHQG